MECQQYVPRFPNSPPVILVMMMVVVVEVEAMTTTQFRRGIGRSSRSSSNMSVTGVRVRLTSSTKVDGTIDAAGNHEKFISRDPSCQETRRHNIINVWAKYISSLFLSRLMPRLSWLKECHANISYRVIIWLYCICSTWIQTNHCD